MWNQKVLQVGLGIILSAGAVFAAGATDMSGDSKDMVLIARGEFTMGSHEHADEVRHQVVLDAYLIDKFEASNEKIQGVHEKATDDPSTGILGRPAPEQPDQLVVGA